MSRLFPDKNIHKKQRPGRAGAAKAAGLHWRIMNKQIIPAAEKLLRERELLCVAACSRFLTRRSFKDTVCTLQSRDGNIHALIIYSNRVLLPVFCGHKEIPEPGFFHNIFGVLPIHSVQGLTDEALFLESCLSKCGLEAVDKIDYDLMYIDKASDNASFSTGPAGLILRKPQYSDIDSLAALQAAYEQEEVLPQGAVFNPAVSRLNTERIFANEQLLVAELGGCLVGKINTSAFSFSRFQIGGVYVLPAFRSMGIAQRMTAEFVCMLIAQGRGVSLFVKKSNPAARSVYDRLGFEFLADYRISYF